MLSWMFDEMVTSKVDFNFVGLFLVMMVYSWKNRPFVAVFVINCEYNDSTMTPYIGLYRGVY